MSNRIEYRGFIQSYDAPVNKLTTLVKIKPVLSVDTTLRIKSVELTALWDTGATISCIKPSVKDMLKLTLVRSSSSVNIAGIGGIVKADVTLLSIFLVYNLEIEYCPLYVVDFPGSADIIIGMDIIGMGDLAVCNADGKTTFSFAIPPFPDKIDLAAKADAFNKQIR